MRGVEIGSAIFGGVVWIFLGRMVVEVVRGSGRFEGERWCKVIS